MFQEGTSTGPGAVLISCETCAMRHSDHCRDCVVQALVEPDARRSAIVIDADEERAIRELAHAGLVPEIRMRRRRRTA